MARHKTGDQADSKREADLFGAYLNNFSKNNNQREDQQDNSNETNNINSPNSNSNCKTTESQTMMHILKANIGTGVLAMPIAFRHVGLWFGLILIPVIGAICIHCMNILIQSHNTLCDRFNYESLDYDQVAALSLACGPKLTRRIAKYANIVVTIFLMFTQIGFCCVYTLFAVENLQLAMFNLFNLDYSTTTYLIVTFPIIGLASCTSNLKHLARISTLANILQSTGLALIFFDLFKFNTYVVVVGLNGETNTQTNNNNNGLQNIQVQQGFASDLLAGLPLFFATAVYAFEGIGVVLPLIKEMQHPNRISGLNGVLNTSMSIVGLLYVAMGFFGYAKYGQHVAASITLNLPETTLNELVRLCFAIAIGLSYSLQFYVPWTIVWPLIDESLFYSYRPRVARDKLEILNKLSAENHWALDEALQSERDDAKSEQDADEAGHHAEDDLHLDLNNSNASTFATSYSMSLAAAANHHRRQPNGSASNSLSISQYGTLASAATTGTSPAKLINRRRLRNRLEDVMEDEDEMPQVHWRPPPRSMRGKRKLVRYTVILLTVSFTCKYLLSELS